MYFWDPAFGSRFLMTFVWSIGASEIVRRVGWRRSEAMQVWAQAGTGKKARVCALMLGEDAAPPADLI